MNIIMQDFNFWFYTISAIPQTLAAMFALVIAILVFRTDSFDKVIERDVKDSKNFLLPIFDDLEIHEIEAMTGKDYLRKMEIAVNNTLKKDASNLGLTEQKYQQLRALYNTKVREYERGYSPDENRIFQYLLVKKDSIRTHILSKNTINFCFVILVILTTLSIFTSLYYLPKASIDLMCKFKIIHAFSLVNVIAISIGVLIMVFTKKFLKIIGNKVI